MKDISYNTLEPVLQTWDDARFGSNNFDMDFAMNVLEKFFEINPEGKKVFGFAADEKVPREKAGMHGQVFASVFDSVFQMLGPDKEFIEEMLAQVGRRHKAMGIDPKFFPDMGPALLYAVEQSLKRKLTTEETDAWVEIYTILSTELITHIVA